MPAEIRRYPTMAALRIGEGDQAWSFFLDLPKDPDDHSLAWRLRYDPESLTKSDMLTIASVLEQVDYLVFDAPTTRDATRKIAQVRRAVREMRAKEVGNV